MNRTKRGWAHKRKVSWNQNSNPLSKRVNIKKACASTLTNLLGLGESSCLLGGVLLGGLPLLEKGLWDFWESGKIGEQARDR
jgi:hypothetical protein